MEKIKLWFVYEPVTKKEKISEATKKVIGLIIKLEKSFNKNIFDLRSIDYSRFILESNIKIKKNELPATIINNQIVFTKKLPKIFELNKRISKLIPKEGI